MKPNFKTTNIWNWNLFVSLFLGSSIYCFTGCRAKSPEKVPLKISPETTSITEPLTADGYVDYLKAVNQQLAKGVTKENNAASLLWQVRAPLGELNDDPDSYFQSEEFQTLGIPKPTQTENTFVYLYTHLAEIARKQLRLSNTQKLKPIQEKKLEALIISLKQQLPDTLYAKPWSARNYPHLASWIQRNEKAFKIMKQASQKTDYYSPIRSYHEDFHKEHSLVDYDGDLYFEPLMGTVDDLVIGLLTRCMLFTEQGKISEACQDLQCCYNFSSLLWKTGFTEHFMQGVSLEFKFYEVLLSMIQSKKLRAQHLKNLQKNLERNFQVEPSLKKFFQMKRYELLDSSTYALRKGMNFRQYLSSRNNDPEDLVSGKLILSNTDWNQVLKEGNSWYDQHLEAIQMPPGTARNQFFKKLDQDLKNKRHQVGKAKGVSGKSPQQMADYVLNLLISYLDSPAEGMINLQEKLLTRRRMLQIVIALELYHQDHRGYPKKLAELKPKYLTKIPREIFVKRPFRYKCKQKNAYQLLSVGPNQKVDSPDRKQNQTSRTSFPDDLLIKMPRH